MPKMPRKILIAVVTCHKNTARADSQRFTWAKDVHGADVRFFFGRQDTDTPREPQKDEVFLDAPDDYQGLPFKQRAVVTWALSNGYDLMFKTDDDIYIWTDRLLAEIPSADYVGAVNTQAPGWISGFGYWLSKKAMGVLFHAEIPVATDDPCSYAEDRWVSSVMQEAHIPLTNDPEIRLASTTPQVNSVTSTVKVMGEFTPKTMFDAHRGPLGWKARSAMLAEQRRRKGIYPVRGDGTPLV